MPAPSAKPPPRPETALPTDIDALLRRAMRGEGLAELTQALRDAQQRAAEERAAEERAAEARAAREERERDALSRSEPRGRREPRASPPVALSDAGAVARALRAAADAIDAAGLTAKGLAKARAALDEADTLLSTMKPVSTGVSLIAPRAEPPEGRRGEPAPAPHATEPSPAPAAPSPAPPPAPPPSPPADAAGLVLLPPPRLPYALAVSDLPANLTAQQLADAAGVDIATARLARRAGGTRILVRSADAAALERGAAALRETRARAAVLRAEDLRAYGPVLTLVGVDREGTWRVVEGTLWRTRPDPTEIPRGVTFVPPEPRLFVVGDVEERRLRAPAAESRWSRARYAAPNGAGGEDRRFVLDVHFDTQVVRLAEGVVGAGALGLADPNASRRAITRFLEALQARHPRAYEEPSRTCAATPQPGETHADGWAAWEEHSRVCRRLYLS